MMMKKKTFLMPEVADCEATDCAYNRDQLCRALAITVGNGTQPMCDTAFNGDVHTRGEAIAGVGACKVSRCHHNTDLECHADTIQVILSSRIPMCGTFAE